MTAATTTNAWVVKCTVPECGREVAPTTPGGDRPREHSNPNTGLPCPGPRASFTLPTCSRCGKHPRAADGCGSPLYHPRTWTQNVGGVDVELGNAAAAGELVGVKGPDYQWLARAPKEDSPRRAPSHVAISMDGVRGYSLAAVGEYVKKRPGPGGNGPAPAEPATPDLPAADAEPATEAVEPPAAPAEPATVAKPRTPRKRAPKAKTETPTTRTRRTATKATGDDAAKPRAPRKSRRKASDPPADGTA